jgi:hypothetical protein
VNGEGMRGGGRMCRCGLVIDLEARYCSREVPGADFSRLSCLRENKSAYEMTVTFCVASLSALERMRSLF